MSGREPLGENDILYSFTSGRNRGKVFHFRDLVVVVVALAEWGSLEFICAKDRTTVADQRAA